MTRINKFIALATGMSRRSADKVIGEGRVRVNDTPAHTGQEVQHTDSVTLDDAVITTPMVPHTIMLNKPAGYVVSRDGQGSKTIYDLLLPELYNLKPVGRLDKNSSGLLLLTNDGALTQELTHPAHRKTKRYEVVLDKQLQPLHRQMIQDHGVQLEDGPSSFQLTRLHNGSDTAWQVSMHEGRNRQIRRTFAALGYEVTELHRTHFGRYTLPKSLHSGDYMNV